MFRKPKKKIIQQRTRNVSGSEDEQPVKPSTACVDVSDDDGPSIVAQPKKPTLLSFDEDEGNDTEFKIKKPSHKKRAEKMARKMRELEEIEKEKSRIAKLEIDSEIGLVVKNPIVNKKPYIDPSSSEDRQTTESDPIIVAAIENDLEIRSRFGGFEGIPDAKTVYEAKKRREQMRRDGTKAKLNSNNDEGFIPISQGTSDKVVRSRLVREDDNDMSDEDGENNGEFYSSKTLLISEEERRRKEQEEFLRVEGESDDDDNLRDDEENAEAKRQAAESDEEFARWEKHQIQKAVSSKHVRQLKKHNRAITNQKYSSTIPDGPDLLTIDDDDDMDVEIVDESSGFKSVNVPALSIASLAEVVKKLKIRIDAKKEFVAGQKHDLKRKQETIAENQKFIDGIGADFPVSKEKYRVYQEIRVYIRDLLDCINEKFGSLSEIEQKIFVMWKVRADRLMKRRRADIADEYQKCREIASGKPYQPAADVELRERQRDGRRTYRQHQREKAGIDGQHEQGLSSDEEEPASQQFEEQRIIEGLESAGYLFADAAEEFSDIGKIMSRFADWMLVDQKSFDDAYVALFLPKLLSPLIRLELLDWNPLKDVSRPLHDFSWYKQLLLVGTDKVGFDLENPIIVGLIPAVIERLYLPRLTKIVIDHWDPFSLSQTRNLTYFLNGLIDEYPTLNASSKNVQNLLTATVKKFKSTIAEDSFVPLFSKNDLNNKATGCAAFLNRRFWSVIKLIQSATCFRQILSRATLQELIIDGLINRGIVLALQLSPHDSPKTLTKCNAVVDAIPAEWIATIDPTQFRSLVTVLKIIFDKNRTKGGSKIDKFLMALQNTE